MKISNTNSKVLTPLIGAFVSLVLLVLVIWFIHMHFSQRVYDVLAHHAASSEKMHIITSLIETAHFRTRLTGQMLVTKDVFERDEITQKLDIYAARFARLRQQLLALPLTDEEKAILHEQSKMVLMVLPKQRAAADLAMSDEQLDLEKARHLLYYEVIPGQATLINYFMDMLIQLRDDVIFSSATATNSHKRVSSINLILIIIFVIATVVVASATIQRILAIEKNLKSANQELIRLNHVKSDFVSLVSHELRTPLTSIKSFAEILMDDIDEMDIETQKRYLSIIDSEGDRLTRLVSNILDLQKIDANKMNWNDEELILNNIAQNSIDAFAGAYQTKGIGLNIGAVSEELTVIADADKLKQVFANLLSNALKFTQKGEVLVTVYRHTNKATDGSSHDSARVSVRDTGTGIPVTELTKVFNSFHQVDNSATREKGGSGLGLDICRKIINHYEGNIWVESEMGKGSSFFFEIPLVRAAQKTVSETLVKLGMSTEDQLKIALRQQSS